MCQNPKCGNPGTKEQSYQGLCLECEPRQLRFLSEEERDEQSYFWEREETPDADDQRQPKRRR